MGAGAESFQHLRIDRHDGAAGNSRIVAPLLQLSIVQIDAGEMAKARVFFFAALHRDDQFFGTAFCPGGRLIFRRIFRSFFFRIRDDHSRIGFQRDLFARGIDARHADPHLCLPRPHGCQHAILAHGHNALIIRFILIIILVDFGRGRFGADAARALFANGQTDFFLIRIDFFRKWNVPFYDGQRERPDLSGFHFCGEDVFARSAIVDDAILIHCRAVFIGRCPLNDFILRIFRDHRVLDLVNIDMLIVSDDIAVLAERDVLYMRDFVVRDVFGRQGHVLFDAVFGVDEIAVFILPAQEGIAFFLRVIFLAGDHFVVSHEDEIVHFAVHDKGHFVREVVHLIEVFIHPRDAALHPVFQFFNFLQIVEAILRPDFVVAVCGFECFGCVLIQHAAVLHQLLEFFFQDGPLFFDFIYEAAFRAVAEHWHKPHVVIFEAFRRGVDVPGEVKIPERPPVDFADLPVFIAVFVDVCAAGAVGVAVHGQGIKQPVFCGGFDVHQVAVTGGAVEQHILEILDVVLDVFLLRLVFVGVGCQIRRRESFLLRVGCGIVCYCIVGCVGIVCRVGCVGIVFFSERAVLLVIILLSFCIEGWRVGGPLGPAAGIEFIRRSRAHL